MVKAKVSEEFTPVTDVATTNEDTALAVMDFTEGTVDLTGMTEKALGAPPFIKAPRGMKAGKLAGTITYDKDNVICEVSNAIRMLVVGNRPLYATAYNMEQDAEDKWFRPRFKNEADGIAKGYDRLGWEDGPEGRVGPNNVPAMDLLVLVEAPDAIPGTAFNGSNWVKGVLSCCAQEFSIAQNFLRKWGQACNVEGRTSWMLEFSLSLYKKKDNYYMQSACKNVHLPNSDFAEEYRSVFG